MNIREWLRLYRSLGIPRHQSRCGRRTRSGIHSLQGRKSRSDLEDASVIIHNGPHRQKARNLDLRLTSRPLTHRRGRVFNGADERPRHLVLRVDELAVLAPEQREIGRRDDVEEGQLIQLLHRLELEELHKEGVALQQLARVDLDDEARHAVVHPDPFVIDPVPTHAAAHFLHRALVHFRAVAREVAGAGGVPVRVHWVHNAGLVRGIDRDPRGAERGVIHLALEEVVVVFVREDFVFAANSIG